jgi:NhaA family Na+:H+ antiporter
MIPSPKRISLIKQFLQLESSSAIVLFMTTMLAMILANSPLASLHQRFIDLFLFWINEGLMAIFFLVVALELKRGFIEGQLSRLSQVILPFSAAIGGMVFPALIYCLINFNHPETLKGWATPVATDIVFALGVLSLFGKRVPTSLKLFLLMLAIFDDIGAILIIAFFYTSKLSYLWLSIAASIIIILFIFNKLHVKHLSLYIFFGILLWLSFLQGGIHPTIAGVLLAFFIPADDGSLKSPLLRLENALHPYVAYGIMPIFTLANAGISLEGLSFATLTDVVVLGIVLGLFFGKQLGVFGISWLLVQLGLVKLPEKSSWMSLYGVSLLCGIGFTMSLFLGTLSFENVNNHLVEVRLGVIIGSILSGLSGAIVLQIAFIKVGFSPKRSSVID